MAKVTQVENLGVLYNIEDITARDTAQVASATANRAEGKADDNAEELLAINAKIPSSASPSNKLVAESSLANYPRFYSYDETVPTDKFVTMHNSPSSGWLFQMEVSLQNKTPRGDFTNAKRIMFGIDAEGGFYVLGYDSSNNIVATKHVSWDI